MPTHPEGCAGKNSQWGKTRGKFPGKSPEAARFRRGSNPSFPPNPGSETTGLLPPASVSLRKDHPLRKRRFSFRRSFAIMRALSSLGQPLCGRVAEWSNAPDSKSGIRLYRIEGSNPSPSAMHSTQRLATRGPLFYAPSAPFPTPAHLPTISRSVSSCVIVSHNLP